MSTGGLASIFAVLVVASLSLLQGGCAPSSQPAAQQTAAGNQVAELQVRDVAVGQGATASAGSKVTVHYTGWLYDSAAPDHRGKEFDSSRRGGNPFRFRLGARQVIAGWDQGVAGMREGGRRQLVIPSELAYGDQGAGGVIPPGATLVFDVELLDVEP
ncbi:MAG TPA: FKBP-type peptidyl-prolyl cis-trans isomerase [Steroidobacteraceae bacterium]|nr:FKBP-type peptidyl-prolyl cis-trans isomerase [Steroidobacteraceae bacterium]